MTRKTGKSMSERAIKKSVSMPLWMFIEAEQLRRSERLPTFSDCIQWLIRNKLPVRDSHH